MKKIALVCKPAKQELEKLVPELAAWLEKRGYEVIADPDAAKFAGRYSPIPRTEIASHKPDVVIVLGGDGTLLAAARALAKDNIPLLAVNLCSPRFFTVVPVKRPFVT